jgi:hypothetical protein
MLESSWIAAQLAAATEGLSSVSKKVSMFRDTETTILLSDNTTKWEVL